MCQEGLCLPAAAFFFVCLVGVHAALYTKKKALHMGAAIGRQAKSRGLGSFLSSGESALKWGDPCHCSRHPTMTNRTMKDLGKINIFISHMHSLATDRE